jgi:protein-S-isoprenylcysteine O-methyltransferase Ste14
MPELALVLLVVFGGFAFGVRVLIQLWRTGSTGLHGLSPDAGPVEWAAGASLVAGFALSAVGPLLDQGGSLDPIAALDGDFGRAAGVVLALGGMAITIGAQLAMGDAWRIGVDPEERTELVTDGPFAVVRNPIYSGMIPFFWGIVLLVPNVVTLAGAVCVTLALELQTRIVEEPYLLRTHGERYADYAARVGRFLPRVGRIRPG